MPTWIRFALFAAAFVFAAPAASADEVTEQLQLPSFEFIDAVGTLTMNVEVGDTQSVQVIRDGSIAAQLEVRNGVLVVRSPSSPRADGMVRILITVPQLRGVSFDSIWSHLTVTQINSPRFRLRLRSSSDANLSGVCELGEFVTIGAPQLDADELACRDVNVEVSGAGRVDVRASRRAAVNIVGSGEVDLYGNAEVVANSTTRRKITIHRD